jgi:hypothetical protein
MNGEVYYIANNNQIDFFDRDKEEFIGPYLRPEKHKEVY